MPGDAVAVLDSTGHLLGHGLYNPRAGIACRLLTRRDELVDAGLFHRRLAGALRFRQTAGLAGDGYRLCWSEADGLPGLVVDRYGPVSVVQCQTLGMSRLGGWVAGALGRLFPEGAISRADDATAARVEGFEPQRGWLTSAPGSDASDEIEITDGPCRLLVTLGAGHKTGLYLDQRANHALVAPYAAGRRMLDAFAYHGAFACHGLLGGAARAVLVESSAEALAAARRNLETNGVAARAELRATNVFDELRQLEAAHERFGVVVLDPPPFTRRKEAVAAAARGYKEINIRGLRLLEPGGVLATFSCSHHVTPEMFEGICRDAAGDAGVTTRILAPLTQARDHPVLLNVPETRYLTGLLLQTV